jgi:drug/metabolite transporter (DMT)-like permease
MIYLALTILMSLLIAVILKINESRAGARLVVAGSNYVSASLLGLLLGSASGMSITAGWSLLGMAVGAGFVAGFMLLMRTIRDDGIAVPTSVARLSMLVPVIGSVLFFDEHLDDTRLIGILLGIVAFILLGLAQHRPGDGTRIDIRSISILLSLFLVIGLNDLAMKAVQQADIGSSGFLLLVFGTAAIICWIIVAIRRTELRRNDVALGALLGIPNYLSTYFLMLSLEQLPAALVFPVVSAGGVVAATLAGIIVWREVPKPLGMMGIALAAIAVAILSLGE